MKKKTYVTVLVAMIVAAFFMGCEKDDICPEGTPTTPLLILRFYDAADTEQLKTVTNLRVIGEGQTEEFSLSTTDSIAIPLRALDDFTTFTLTREYDADDASAGNEDEITFNYTPEEIYVNRACGFKVNYTLNATDGIVRPDDGDQWIINTEIISSVIENENAAHVKIFH